MKRTEAAAVPESKETIRCWKFEIVAWSGDRKDVVSRWFRLQDQCREIVNAWFQSWESRHVTAGNHIRVRDFMRAHAAWKKRQAEIGQAKSENKRRKKSGESLMDVPEEFPRPAKCDVDCYKPDDGQSLYLDLSHAPHFATVHTQVLTMLQQGITKRLSGKDCEGVWSMWMAILSNRQGRPSAERSQPIPVAPKYMADLVEVDRGRFRTAVEVSRVPRDGRCSLGVRDEFEFIAKGGGYSIAKRIESGEYRKRGAKLVYNRDKRKWFVVISYGMPVASVAKPGDGVALIVPGRAGRVPFEFMHLSGEGSYRRWVCRGGRGAAIEAARRRLLTSRWTEQETYRWAGAARKGHGRKRALGPIEILRNRWRNLVTTYNRNVAAEVVRECVQRKVGTLIYYQPTGDMRDNRFVSLAGKVPGRRDSTLWDFHQLGVRLAEKCAAVGIELRIVKHGESRGWWAKEKLARGASVRKEDGRGAA